MASSEYGSVVAWGWIPGPGMLYFRCNNLALDIRDTASLMGRGGSVAECRFKT